MRISTTLKATLRALAVAGVAHATTVTAEVSGPKIRIEVPGGLSTSEFCEPLFFHAACKYIVEMYFDNQLSQSSCDGVPGNQHEALISCTAYNGDTEAAWQLLQYMWWELVPQVK